MINFENLDKFMFHGVGKYDIPQIEPVYELPRGELIPINLTSREKNLHEKIAHFFVDDYRFIPYWNSPDRYIPRLLGLEAVCAPDFSTYPDMPLAMQIYNHYRKHWLAAYWQLHGMKVYPTIGWSDERSFDWCFDGEPVGGVISVSSVGTQRSRKSKRLFLHGYDKMLERLEPSAIIFHGGVPEDCQNFGGNIIRIEPYYERIAKRRKEKAAIAKDPADQR